MRLPKDGMKRRLRRITFNGLTLLSLLFCSATCVLWVQSYWSTIGWNYLTSSLNFQYTIKTYPGQLVATVIGPDPEFDNGLQGLLHSFAWRAGAVPGEVTREIDWDGRSRNAAEEDAVLERLAANLASYGSASSPVVMRHLYFGGFRWFSGDKVIVQDLHSCIVPPRHDVGLPLWFLTLCFGVFPIVSVTRSVQRGRDRAAGRCEVCRYDLTGNVSGVCPECGMKVEAARGTV